jgi:hypothetical protein
MASVIPIPDATPIAPNIIANFISFDMATMTNMTNDLFLIYKAIAPREEAIAAPIAVTGNWM